MYSEHGGISRWLGFVVPNPFSRGSSHCYRAGQFRTKVEWFARHWLPRLDKLEFVKRPLGAARMQEMLSGDIEERNPSKVSHQAIWFSSHVALALGSWLALMLLGYAFNPPAVSQIIILLASTAVPLLVGYGMMRVRQDETAPLVWLVGLIWLLIISLWILDMPTGPNACFQCDATDKLSRTLFSLPRPSGLIDDDGPFIGTWPAAALLGYSIGARLGLRKKT